MIVCLALAALLCGTLSAHAASSFYPEIYVSLTGAQSEADVGARLVRLWEYGTNTTFFLPACTDGAKLTLFYSAQYAVKIDGEAYASGQALCLDMTKTHTILYGRTERKLRFMFSQHLPAVFLQTESGGTDYIHAVNGNKEPGSVLVLNTAGETLCEGPLEHVRGRGNSSFSQPKKPYQIKFAQKTSLFGMNAAKKWVLLANHKDVTFLRNEIMFEAADMLGAAYPLQGQLIDLYMNGCYLGNYQLCEKVETAGGRIEIEDLEEKTEALNDQPLNEYKRFGSSTVKTATQKGFEIPNNPEDITGGYLLELEKSFHYPESRSGFVTRRGQPVVIKSPEFASREQVAYISDYIQHFEDALFAEDGVDPVTGRHYTDYIDLDSMVCEYLLEEVFKNYDVNKSSQFIVKPSDSENKPAVFGPAWDFDLSMGDWADEYNLSVASPKRLLAAAKGNAYYWLPRLYTHQDFYERAITLYYERFVPYLKALLGEAKAQDAEITPLALRGERLTASAAMNFTRWPILNSDRSNVKTGTTYPANIDHLSRWLTARMAFLDTEWLADYNALLGK